MRTQSSILDQWGQPLTNERQIGKVNADAEVQKLRRQIRHMIHARFDAAQTVESNVNHWRNADYLDPHASAILWVRRTLRIRSRYELVENNPYLKGCALTLCNDFTGSGPKVAITEPWERSVRTKIEAEFERWWDACKLTTKLWRARMAKLVDGETFGLTVTAKRRPLPQRDVPVTLDFFMVEADRISSPLVLPLALPTYQDGGKMMEADGVRWDLQENPIEYNLLPYHPGNMLFPPMGPIENWIKADQVLHWFRQDRGWLRGIPEMTTSLPLCALLRRYTIAVVRAAEIHADLTGVIESEAPPQALSGLTIEDDDPFDVFAPEPGMIMRLPWGYKLKAFEGNQPIQVYDVFVNTLLREILRPINMPHNLGVGSSEDSNMASAIVDTHIYRGTQKAEREHCERHILNLIFCLWYAEARLIEGYLPPHKNRWEFPTVSWRWDKVGLDHTDPEKVMKALEIAHTKGFLTDRDIQEQHFNRDVEEWREQIQEDNDFREKIDLPINPDAVPEPLPASDSSPGKKKAKASSRLTYKGSQISKREAQQILDRLMNNGSHV